MNAESALVDAATRGSREAFDELVRLHQREVFGLMRAMTAGSPDADDLAQEAFVRAWRGIGRFRGESSFRTWLVGIAINVARTHRGRSARLRRMFADASSSAEPGGDALDRASVDDGIETSFVQRDAIERALAALPEEMREVVVLRDIQGLEYREIAEALGIPVGTVESRIFRGRQRLRPLLGALRGK